LYKGGGGAISPQVLKTLLRGQTINDWQEDKLRRDKRAKPTNPRQEDGEVRVVGGGVGFDSEGKTGYWYRPRKTEGQEKKKTRSMQRDR